MKNFLWFCGLALLLAMCSTTKTTPSKTDYGPVTRISDLKSTTSSFADNGLEERCKDWIYNRNRAYKLGKEGDQKGSAKASRAMRSFMADLERDYSSQQISEAIANLEKSGYRAGF
jgi:hypothetical protein